MKSAIEQAADKRVFWKLIGSLAVAGILLAAGIVIGVETERSSPICQDGGR